MYFRTRHCALCRTLVRSAKDQGKIRLVLVQPQVWHPSFAKLARPTSHILASLLFAFHFIHDLLKQLFGRRESHQPPRGSIPNEPVVEPRAARLPPELVQRVADYLFELVPPTADSSGSVSVLSSKPPWRDVSGFMNASVGFHKMGFQLWMLIISVKNIEDWDVIKAHIEFVREIYCFDGTLIDPAHQHTFSTIPHLYAAIIDAHGDVWRDERNRFAYRDVISTLPPSLKRLEVKHAHGPDVRVILSVKEHCPNLEELMLGRCTMFNRSPACEFWQSFPHDHDAYMSNVGTDGYAHSLGNELVPLRRLRSLRLGLYLVPSNIVLAHRLYHRRGLPAPEIIHWQSAIPLAELPVDPPLQELPPGIEPATTAQLVSLLHQDGEETRTEFKCTQCMEITAHSGSEAENAANSILREYVPTLVCVEWMGWSTPQHLGVHSYRFSA